MYMTTRGQHNSEREQAPTSTTFEVLGRVRAPGWLAPSVVTEPVEVAKALNCWQAITLSSRGVKGHHWSFGARSSN